jgi:hypothetical protein
MVPYIYVVEKPQPNLENLKELYFCFILKYWIDLN